jgi:hypothetical protein
MKRFLTPFFAPIPSDHAPLLIDIDKPGYPFDAGWLRRTRELRRAARGIRDEPTSSRASAFGAPRTASVY